MKIYVLPLIFSIVIGLTYYYVNKLKIKNRPGHEKLLSIAAGVSVTYILLELFPSFTEVAFIINRYLFVTILLGFVIHHLIEKEIYQHNQRNELVKLLTVEENVFSFSYHIILGIILVVFSRQSFIQGILAFVPILTFTLVSTIPLRTHNSKPKAIALASSTLIGVLLAITLKIPLWFEFSLIGTAIGILLYTIIRHHIPFGRKGNVSYFVLGTLLYTAFIVLTWHLS